MDKKTVLRMAEKAGLGQVANLSTLEWKGGAQSSLIEFAELIAAVERERCIDIVLATALNRKTLGEQIRTADLATEIRASSKR